MDVEKAVRFSLSAIFGVFIFISVFYTIKPYLFPDKGMEGFFILSKKPKECISIENYPEYILVVPSGNSYRKYLSYEGNLSGMHRIEGYLENGTYNCTLLIDVRNGTWITREERRNITYFRIEVMK